jgi:hypothetical protein
VLAGVLWTAAASLVAGDALAAAPASPFARFAALLSPGVPRGLAELLMTPLLAWPIEMPPFWAARLQLDAPAINATADSAISMFVESCRMIRSPWNDSAPAAQHSPCPDEVSLRGIAPKLAVIASGLLRAAMSVTDLAGVLSVFRYVRLWLTTRTYPRSIQK